MPSASSSTTRSIRGRSIPLLTASALSITAYYFYNVSSPLLNDSRDPASAPIKPKRPLVSPVSPYTPIGWGSNRYQTLLPDLNLGVLKRPTSLPQLGSSPLRDLVIAEKYGACVDARGDCWMWGAGYDPSGEIGRSLKGKGVSTLIPAPAKLLALSSKGKLYILSASKAFQDRRTYRSEQGWWSWLFGSSPGVDFVELKAEKGLRRGERWIDVSAGVHHVIAVTSKGRVFSLPLSPNGNSHRQLGTRQVFDTPFPVPSSAASSLITKQSAELPPEADIRFATKLTEIPALQGINAAQVAASDRTSFVRTTDGKVVGFGGNEAGQLGLGANAAVDIVPTPVEVVLARNYPGGTALNCTDVKSGSQTAFFTVERTSPRQGTFVELLACGNGMSGALGNGLWSSANGVPTKVKTVSGLQEYSEKENAFVPISIHSISVASSPSSHIFAVLDTVAQAESTGLKKGLYGRDVMVWGGNGDYQLGNGKRSSLAVPQHLPPISSRLPDALDPLTEVVIKESEISSGTLSPMPHSRLQFHTSKANAYDLDGRLIKRNVKCEETIVAGWNASVLYNKIIQ